MESACPYEKNAQIIISTTSRIANPPQTELGSVSGGGDEAFGLAISGL